VIINPYAFGGGGGGGTTAQSLLHFEGTNGSVTFTDETGKTWPATGPTISTARSRAGSASGLFAGTDYITCTGGTDFAFGTGDFCVNLSVYFSSLATAILVDNRFGSYNKEFVLYYDGTDSKLKFFANGADRIAATGLSASTWYDLEVERTSGVTKFFVNGTKQGSDYADTNDYQTSQIMLGKHYAVGLGLIGNLDEFRLIKGTGGHTSNYTPTFPLT